MAFPSLLGIISHSFRASVCNESPSSLLLTLSPFFGKTYEDERNRRRGGGEGRKEEDKRRRLGSGREKREKSERGNEEEIGNTEEAG